MEGGKRRGGEIRTGQTRSSLSPLTRRWSALIPFRFDFELRQLRARFREIDNLHPLQPRIIDRANTSEGLTPTCTQRGSTAAIKERRRRRVRRGFRLSRFYAARAGSERDGFRIEIRPDA